VRSSGGKASDSSRGHLDHTRRANLERELASEGPRWSSAGLPADFSQHYGNLVQAMRDAQGRTLTSEEQQAVALLIRALHNLLDGDDRLPYPGAGR
jgi:hypothetical protein